MGGNESRSKPTSESGKKTSLREMKPMRARTTKPAPEKVLVWPKNSARWQKPYDVYICSSDQDIVYATALLSYLQEQPENLRCFLPVKDMNPGGAIPTEIVDGVENSHCWVLLLTSSSLSDQWCQYQMHQFLALAPNGNGCLIPVMLQLSFERYPKELRHMFSYKDPYGNKEVFEPLKKAIVHYLTSLPTITPDQDSEEETPSNASESSQSSSPVGVESQDTSSQTPESTSDTLRRSMTQGSTSDTLRRSMTQTSTGDTLLRNSVKSVSPGDTSISCVTQGSTSDISRRSVTQGSTGDTLLRNSVTPRSPGDTSLRSSTTQESTNITCSVNQETVSEPSLKFPYQQESTSNSIESLSLNQESTLSMSIRTYTRQGYTCDIPMTSPITEVSTCATVMGSTGMEDFTSETYLRATSPKPDMDLSLRNYKTLACNNNTLTTMDSSRTNRISTDQEYAITREVHCGSYKKEETINMDCHSFGSDIYTSSATTPTKDKGSTSLHSITYTECGGSQVNKDSAVLHGDIYTSCGGTSAEIKDSLDLQGDIYTSCRTKADTKVLQSLQSNIYTSCKAKTEAKDSACDLYTSGGSQVGKKDTLSLQSNIYTSSGRSRDVQSLQKDRYTSCGVIEAKTGDSEVLLEDIYAIVGGMQTKKVDSPSHQSDINSMCAGKCSHVDLQSLQTDIYTSSKGNQREETASCCFQSDLYTSHRETQEELKNAQNLPCQINPGFGGLQASNKLSESLQNDIYTSSDGMHKVTKDFPELCSDLYLSGTGAQTIDQTFTTPQGNSCTICTDTQAEGKDSYNVYTSCTGANALGSDSCEIQGNIYMNRSSTPAVKPTIHTHKNDRSRPASEAADKT